MFNKISLFLLLFLVGCSPEPSSQLIGEGESTFLLSQNGFKVGGTTDAGTSNKTVNLYVNFTNEIRQAVVPTEIPHITDDTASIFSITSVSGCSPVAAKLTCTVRLSFIPKDKAAGAYTANLRFHGISIPLTGTVAGQVLNPLTISLEGNSAVIEEYNFGDINKSVVQSFVIKNTTTSTVNVNATLEGKTFSQILNTCSSTIRSQKTCNVRIAFSGEGKSPGSYQTQLKINGKDFKLSASIPVPALPVTPPINEESIQLLADNQVLYSKKIVFSTLEPNKSQVKTLTIKNLSSVLISNQSLKLEQGTDIFQVLSNSCVNVNLRLNASCSMKIGFSASNRAQGTYIGKLKFSNLEIDLEATTVGSTNVATCPAGQHINPLTKVCENNKIVCASEIPNAFSAYKDWSGSTYSACKLDSCQNNFHAENNSCVNNLQSCSLPFGQGTKIWLGNQYSACSTQDCEAGYHVNNGTCELNFISCMVENGNGQKVWDYATSQFGECFVESCNKPFQLVENDPANLYDDICLKPDTNFEDCSIENGVGIRFLSGANSGQCYIESCNEGYSLNEKDLSSIDDDVCEAQASSLACEIDNGIGRKFWSVQSQDFGPCMVEQCNSAFHLVQGSVENLLDDSCEANVLDCTSEVTHTQDAFKIWNYDANSYNACVAYSCESGSHLDNNQCVVDEVDCTSSIQFASLASKKWDANIHDYSACLVKSCESGYHAENNVCANNVRASCGSSPLPQNSTVVQQEWNPETLSYGACLAVGCSSGYAAQSGVCDVCPNGTIPNAEGSACRTPQEMALFMAPLTSDGSKNDGSNPTAIWTTDGDLKNAQVLSDKMTFNAKSVHDPDKSNSINNNFVKMGSRIYFTATIRDFANLKVAGKDVGRELFYVEESSPYQMKLVKEIFPGPDGSVVRGPWLIPGRNKLLFAAQADIYSNLTVWVTDGTAAGTLQLSTNLYHIQNVTALNNKLYFVGSSADEGTELWETDGSINGTKIVKDINPGRQSGINPGTGSLLESIPLFKSNNKLYFYASNGSNYGLAVSDGTTAGTIILANTLTSNDFAVAVPPTRKGQLFGVIDEGKSNEKILFYCRPTSNTYLYSLCKYNVNSNTVEKLKDFRPGAESQVQDLYSINNKVYFTAYYTSANGVNYGYQPCVSDGTAAGTYVLTQPLLDQYKWGSNSGEAGWSYTLFNGQVYFLAKFQGSSIYLLKHDGTPQGVALLDVGLPNASITGVAGSLVSNILPYTIGNKLIFSYAYQSYGTTLFSIDTQGVVEKKTFVPAGAFYPGTILLPQNYTSVLQ